MTALQWFFVWLTMIAPHTVWLAVVGAPGRPAVGTTSIFYAGNFLQAFESVAWFLAHGVTAFLSQVIP